MLKIKFDEQKCKNAYDCLKCVDACPSGVLLVIPVGVHLAKDSKGRIEPVLMSMCTGCGDCQRVCPAGAVTMLK